MDIRTDITTEELFYIHLTLCREVSEYFSGHSILSLLPFYTHLGWRVQILSLSMIYAMT